MTNDDKERLCRRGLHLLDLGKSLEEAFDELLELMPQARRFTSAQVEKLKQNIARIVEDKRRRWLNDKQAFYRFVDVVDVVASA